MTDINKKIIKQSIYLALVLFCVRCALSGEELIKSFSFYNLFSFAGEAVSITVIVMTLYEKLFWRYNPFEKTPVLMKNYNGVVVSTYDNMIISTSLEIKQTLLSIHISMKTGESTSKANSAVIQKVDGEWQLIYTYTNTPKAAVRDRSEIHHGTGYLIISDPKKIYGQYYTDRKTTGDMEFFPKSRK